MTANKALKEFGVTIPGGLSNNEKIELVSYVEIIGGFFAGIIMGGVTAQAAFRSVFGPITIEVGEGKGPGTDSNGTYLGNCKTELGVISCDTPMDIGNTFHELFHVIDSNYDALNGVHGDSLLSRNYPFEWLNDRRYSYSAYKCVDDCSNSQAHPPSYSGYDLSEAFANAGQNWVLGATNIDQTSYGFNDNDFGDGINNWMNGWMHYYLFEMGLLGG